MKNSRVAMLLLAAGILLTATSLPGCDSGPATGLVEGTVTLDGEPLDQAMLRFQPVNGRGSVGMTDESGHYKLRFTATTEGAIPGEHRVLITTQRAASGGEGDQPLVPAQEEILPAKYNDATELTATVEPGPNTIDFELTSE